MKPIVVGSSKEVHSSSINNQYNNHIGICWGSGGKSWVVKTNEGFIVMEVASTYITNNINYVDIQTLLSSLNVDGNKFFIFDNYVELKIWLLDDE